MGLQSHNRRKNAGFIVIYRESSEKDRHRFNLKLLTGYSRMRLQCLSHDEAEHEIALGAGGILPLHVPEKNSFRLYRYQVVK